VDRSGGRVAPRRLLDPHDRVLRPHPERRVRRAGQRHGPGPRPADPVRRHRAVLRRGAAVPRGGLHDDHQGDRELTSPAPRGRRKGAPEGPIVIFRDNPVLIRELLVTLRSPRSFILQLMYVCALGALVYFYWPAGEGSAHQAKAAEAPPL